MAENERDAKPIFGHFIKTLREAVNLGQKFIETGVHKSFLAALQRKPRASAVSLGSLAMGNML